MIMGTKGTSGTKGYFLPASRELSESEITCAHISAIYIGVAEKYPLVPLVHFANRDHRFLCGGIGGHLRLVVQLGAIIRRPSAISPLWIGFAIDCADVALGIPQLNNFLFAHRSLAEAGERSPHLGRKGLTNV